MLKFIKAQFPNGRKHYDFICDIENIKKGDLVYVMTRYGKRIVTVRGIFYSDFEDMPLPPFEYKNVLAKYTPQNTPDGDGVWIAGYKLETENDTATVVEEIGSRLIICQMSSRKQVQRLLKLLKLQITNMMFTLSPNAVIKKKRYI